MTRIFTYSILIFLFFGAPFLEFARRIITSLASNNGQPQTKPELSWM